MVMFNLYLADINIEPTMYNNRDNWPAIFLPVHIGLEFRHSADVYLLHADDHTCAIVQVILHTVIIILIRHYKININIAHPSMH